MLRYLGVRNDGKVWGGGAGSEQLNAGIIYRTKMKQDKKPSDPVMRKKLKDTMNM